MGNDDFYDDLETRDAAAREQDLFARLPAFIAEAKKDAAYYGALFDGLDADRIVDRAALTALPVTRKSSLFETQTAGDPLGGMTTVPTGGLLRIFQSPGPTYDAEGAGKDWWGTARALYASGMRKGDILHNTFAYHFTPAGVMMEAGAHAIGCAVFPAGVGNTELQVQAIEDIKCTGYTGTPSFLRTILDKADELGKDVSSLRNACVGGEGLLPDLRAAIEDRGIHCGQAYATADLGAIAYETPACEGLVVNEDKIVEVVRPGTGEPVPEGEVGEVVVTVLRSDYPLIRFATGDLSAVMPGQSPCGRTNMRLKGWMGRADQTTKVKGMFVHPAQIAEISKRHPELGRIRAIVTKDGGTDLLTLHCEVAGGGGALGDAISETIQNVCKLKGTVSFAEPESLPNDGKVIEDARDT